MKGYLITILVLALILVGGKIYGAVNSESVEVPIEDARYKITYKDTGRVFYVNSYELSGSVVLNGYYYIANYSLYPIKEVVRYSENIIIIEAGLMEIEDRSK